MEIKYCNRIVKFKEKEYGMKFLCFTFEFKVGDDVLQELLSDFLGGFYAVQQIHELNYLFGKNAEYYFKFFPPYPKLKIVSDFEFHLISKGYFLSGKISENDLKRFGFKSLYEIVSAKYCYNILFTTKKELATSIKKVYSVSLLPTNIEK